MSEPPFPGPEENQITEDGVRVILVQDFLGLVQAYGLNQNTDFLQAIQQEDFNEITFHIANLRRGLRNIEMRVDQLARMRRGKRAQP